jgi:hypothetical protein
LDLRRITLFLFQAIHDVQVREDSKIVIRIGFAIGAEASASHGHNARWIGRRESLYCLDFRGPKIYAKNFRRNSRSQHEKTIAIFLPVDNVVIGSERGSKRLAIAAFKGI